MTLRLACTTLAISCLVSGCASSSSPPGSSPPAIIFEPAAAVFWPLEKDERFRETMMTYENDALRHYLSESTWVSTAVRHKTLAAMQGLESYNTYMAQPRAGKSPIPVDCSTTGTIEFYFVAARPASRTSVSRFTVSYEWSNPELDGKPGNVSRVLTSSSARYVADMKKQRRRSVYIASLPLRDARRVDGDWTLTISHRGHELHQERFKLQDCDKTRVPDWYLQDNQNQAGKS